MGQSYRRSSQRGSRAAASFVLFAALCGLWTCNREERPDRTPELESAGLLQQTKRQEPAPAAAPITAETVAGALERADHAIERARILALPLDPLPAETIQGVALPLYSELPGLSYEAMLAKVAAVGATHVSVVVSWDQQTIHHNELAPDPDTAVSDARLLQILGAAHRAGLKTMIFPIIHVERRGEGEWRGRLAPTAPQAWKADYRRFILHYAGLAARADAAVLSVGSELSSLEDDETFWRGLITEVRGAYDGRLIYSANWDHYETPAFWDALDYIGVSSYFEIATRNDDPIHVMSGRWRGFRDRMVRFAAKHQRPLVLTEVGYPTIDSAAVKPWDYTERTAPNANAQLAAFRSLGDAFGPSHPGAESFAGLFVWHGWGKGGLDDVSYAIWDKPAEDFLRRWFAR